MLDQICASYIVILRLMVNMCRRMALYLQLANSTYSNRCAHNSDFACARSQPHEPRCKSRTSKPASNPSAQMRRPYCLIPMILLRLYFYRNESKVKGISKQFAKSQFINLLILNKTNTKTHSRHLVLINGWC